MSKIKKVLKFLPAQIILLLPHVLYADLDPITSNPVAQKSQGLNNPLKVDSIQELLVILLNLVIIIATPIIVLFIIFAGFKYVTARGNPAKIQEATQALTFAIIGGVLIIGALAITRIIENLVSSFG